MKRVAQLGFTQNGWSAELGRMKNGKAVFDTKAEASWDELDYILEVVRQWVETGTVDFAGEAEQSEASPFYPDGTYNKDGVIHSIKYGYQAFSYPNEEAPTHYGIHIVEYETFVIHPEGFRMAEGIKKSDERIRQTRLFPIAGRRHSAVFKEARAYGSQMVALATAGYLEQRKVA